MQIQKDMDSVALFAFSSPPYMPRHFLSTSPSSTIDLLHEEYRRCVCRSLVVVGMGHVTKIELNNSSFLFNVMVTKKTQDANIQITTVGPFARC